MTRFLPLFVLTMALLAAGGDSLPAQSSNPESGEKGCGFSEAYLQQGWSMPGVPGAVPKGDRLSLSNRPGVFVTEMKPGKSDFTLTVLQCSLDSPGRLVVRPLHVKVLALWRFDVDRRVFAYGVQYEPQYVVGGLSSGSLEYVQAIFYDVDGSGRFTVMRYDNARMFGSLQVPEWVKRAR